MGRKSRPKSPFMNFVMGKMPVDLSSDFVPNCPTCRAPRTEITKADIPADVWEENVAPMWASMEQAGQNPEQVTYCSACKEYGVLCGWESF